MNAAAPTTSASTSTPPVTPASAPLLFNALIVLLLASSWLVSVVRPEAFYRYVAEDGPIEWATFWAFAIGAGVNAVSAARASRRGWLQAWYVAGVALFCFLVAGEEISWGQRLLGYLPPEYFLDHNVQLEANIHNLMPPAVWSFGISAIVGGFGVALPLLLLSERAASIARRAHVYGPPAWWVPGFAALLCFYLVHPFHLSEEVAELALGLGLALAGVQALHATGADPRPVSTSPLLAGAAALALGLGVMSAGVTEMPTRGEESRVAEAHAEIEALREDLIALRREHGGAFATQCDLHARLHTVDRLESVAHLHDGSFARLVSRNAPERADFLLDPWNMPYWISDQCDSAARYILLYSFGPNRRRDSTPWQLGGDDVGAYAFHLGTPRPGDWRELAFPERP